jgi:hypothetical protein
MPESSLPTPSAIGPMPSTGRSLCFLCRSPLHSGNRTEESVLPRWVRSRFHLGTDGATEAGQDDFLLKARTIPCCRYCNLKHLVQIENAVRDAVFSGPDAVRALPPTIVHVWLGKIFYGLMCPDQSSIDNDERRGHSWLMDEDGGLQFHRLFLRGLDKRQMAPMKRPGSLFIFETQVPHRIGLQFDFFDNQPLGCVAIRMGSVGLICVFQDGGMVQDALQPPRGERLGNYPLHPSQFREVVAIIAYKASLMKRVPRSNEVRSASISPTGVSFDDWTAEGFSRWQSIVHGQPVSELFDSRSDPVTYLSGPSGEFRKLNPNRKYRFRLASAGVE